jgi:hypothetical protein
MNNFTRILKFSVWLLWRHIVLAAKIAFGFICAIVSCLMILEAASSLAAPANVAAVGGGVQGEKFFKFMNLVTMPVQYAVEGFVTILGFVAMLVLMFSESLTKRAEANPVLTISILVAIYLVWLYFTAKRIWVETFEVGKVETPTKYAPAGTIPMSLEEGGYFFDNKRVDDPEAFAETFADLSEEILKLHTILAS